jgi:diguanylate cyclase
MLSRLRPRPRGAIDEAVPGGDPGLDVLVYLRARGIPSDPAYYGLVHAALTDRRSVQAHAVNEVVERDGALTREGADAILTALAGPGDDAAAASEAVAAGEERLRHQTLHLADLAAQTAAATGQFGRDLSAANDDLDRDAAAATNIIAAMVERTRESERKLAAAAEQIDRLRDEVAAARNDAMRDSLTGLLNRRGVIDHVAGLDDRPRTIALCDIDAFKAVNDGHGHEVGDRVLKVVAAALEQGCAPHLVGRWGGEEFIVILDETDPASAVGIIDAIRADLASRRLRARETGAYLGVVSFSAGVTALVEPLDDALRTADALLYRAKTGGRNRVERG